jgi:tetratricopeptide (TPR) repeat protein
VNKWAVVTGKKLVLVPIGILLAVMLVELGLRAAGGFLSLGQEMRNRRDLAEGGVYRILCLGESTTQGEWPGPLEEELNRQGQSFKFKVIDKGKGGGGSGVILARLEEQLDFYKPQMVVTMIGINDGDWVWKSPVVYDGTRSIKWGLFFKGMRLNKLAHYLILGLTNHDREESEILVKIDEFNPEKERLRQEELTHMAMVRLAPEKPQGYIALGNFYRELSDFKKAEDAYLAGIGAHPNNQWLYKDLGELYCLSGEIEKAEIFFIKSIEINPTYALAYTLLGDLYYNRRGQYGEAKKMYEAAIRNNPRDQQGYYSLGRYYYLRGDMEKAENFYLSSIKADPGLVGPYHALGNLFREKGEYEKAQKIYKTAIKLVPDSEQAYGELAILYLERGESRKAEAILTQGRETIYRLRKLRGGIPYLSPPQIRIGSGRTSVSLPPVAIRNYRKLRDIVLGRGIKLVCMQYPMREVEPLKKILDEDRGILFVENKRNFEEALKIHKPTEIFEDMFAGDFGHCSVLGNTLIARNLARVISEEVLTLK